MYPIASSIGPIRSSSCVGKTQNPPSSPRQFFERIYGHLENEAAKSDKLCNKSNELFSLKPQIHSNSEGTTRSDCGSVSSPDISARDERFTQSLLPHQDLNKSLQCVPYSIGNPTQHFPIGLSAFLARRRRKEGRHRRQRTTFSAEQTLRLEVEFHRNEYISRSKRFELAETLHLSETQIKIWFQNRRAKDKRIEKAQIDNHYRNIVVANGFMNSLMGQTSYTPTTMVSGIHQNFYHTFGTEIAAQQQATIYPQSIPATTTTNLPCTKSTVLDLPTVIPTGIAVINNPTGRRDSAQPFYKYPTALNGSGNLNALINSY